jgi:hypothetical protein
MVHYQGSHLRLLGAIKNNANYYRQLQFLVAALNIRSFCLANGYSKHSNAAR